MIAILQQLSEVENFRQISIADYLMDAIWGDTRVCEDYFF
jgi:hypothetical protein